MKEIGIVVCNYNKEDYIVNCIKSILDSSIQCFDIYVVDNASTDSSVIRIRESFGNRVNIIVNNENKGGSGGFNTGLREALKQDYRYILLFDNDIVVDRYAIEELHSFLESHEEVGMAGSKVYFMDEPERIWGYGGRINFESYIQEDNYKNCTDSESIPEILYCDYVPACSLMVRTDAVKKVGIMPEDNFIYWDDMEWGYRFNQAGYKVAVWGRSKIWHKAGGRNAGNTFINYYMWRNRIRFFMKFVKADKKEHFADAILTELFRLIYSCNLKGETNIIKSVMYAYEDALYGISGKAESYKILNRNNDRNRLAEALGSSKSLVILFNGNYEGLGNIIRNSRKIIPQLQIVISISEDVEEVDKVKEMFSSCGIVKDFIPKQFDLHFIMCEHIFNVSELKENHIYIDPWCNIIFTKDDFTLCKSFILNLNLFLTCRKDIMLKQIDKSH